MVWRYHDIEYPMSFGRILTCILILTGVVLFFWLDLGSYLTLSNLQHHRSQLTDWYQHHPLLMVFLFMLIYILQTALALPGAAILSLAAGAVFGPLVGTLSAVTAATIGATASVLLTRYLLRDLVMKRFGDRLALINSEIQQRGVNYLLFLRLVPLFPFFLVNLASGLTTIPIRTFMVTTALGILPAGFLFIQAGAAVGQIQTTADILSTRVLLSLVALGILALVPAIYTRWVRR